MKIIALIQIADNTLLATATRCPDLLRREMSKEYGYAKLLWCGLPPVGKNATIAAQSLQLAALKGGISGFFAAKRKMYIYDVVKTEMEIRVKRVFRKSRSMCKVSYVQRQLFLQKSGFPAENK